MPSLLRRSAATALLLLAGMTLVTVSRSDAACPNSSTNCLAGRTDNFATADGSEPSAPSAALLAAMQTGSDPIGNVFDSPEVDLALGHTFTGCWPVGCAGGAILTFHVRGNGGSTDTDTIILGDNASPVYGVELNTLQAIKTGGLDLTWDPGDEATFTLDLANLPPGLGGPTDVRSTLEDGQLDVLIEDDSAIDYIQLYVRVSATPALSSTWGALKATYR